MKSESVKKEIEVRNLYKFYRMGEQFIHALDGIDLVINRGEFCAIIGTSGSGKSTFLNMLAGMESPTTGQIIINKQHIEKLDQEAMTAFRRKYIGYIFQSFNLIGSMTAIENVALPLCFQGIPLQIRHKKAEIMLKNVGLADRCNHFPNQLSGGQQQRVAIARALISNPCIVFADEPTGNLDSKTSEEIMNLLRNIVKKRGVTLVMVTHDTNLVKYADRIIYILDGKIAKIEEKD